MQSIQRLERTVQQSRQAALQASRRTQRTVAAAFRRRPTIVALLLLLLAGLLVAPAAEAYTIMAYVYAADESDDYLLSAVEAGVMDVFFDAGHIIFNAGTYERVSDADTQLRYWVRNTARNGGATHAIELKVGLSGTDPNSGSGAAAEWVEYRLTRIEPEAVIARGRLDAPAAGDRGSHDRRAFRLGIEAGREALRQ